MSNDEMVQRAMIARARAAYFADSMDAMGGVLAALDHDGARATVDQVGDWWAVHGICMHTFLQPDESARAVDIFRVLTNDAALLTSPVAGNA